MAMQMTVKIKGLTELQKGLKTFSRELLDYSSTFRSLGKELIQFYSSKNFSTNGASLGRKWKKLSPRYQAWKTSHWPGRNKLIQTGKMNRSFESHPSRSQLVIDNSDRKFPWHQLGTNSRKKTIMDVGLRGGATYAFSGDGIPARLMLGINKQLARDIKHKFEGALDKKLRKSF